MRRRRTFPALAVAVAAFAALAPASASAAHRTGRYLVAFDHSRTVRSSSALSAVLSRAGVRRAGSGVPRLGIATVRGGAGSIRALRRDPSVAAVSAEWARDYRAVPNDPALRSPEGCCSGVPAGTPIQWSLAREGFPAAWNVTRGDGAIVGVLDSGVDAGHRELAGKVASADAIGTSTSPLTDQDGHGTHVSGLACAATNDGVATAGAGWNCRIAMVKIPRLLDEDVVAGIDRAISRGARAINMSFGGGGNTTVVDMAIDRAVKRGVVLVAAASNDPTEGQGAPASQLQPNDAPDIAAGRGLVVTAAGFNDRRAGTGFGSQVSIAAYGFFSPTSGPAGLVSTFPRNRTSRDFGCPLICSRATFSGSDAYAYLEGTSMAVPQVTAVAALVGRLNPYISARQKIRLIKQTARRPGGWTPDLGWGILDAGRAVEGARRLDRHAPGSRARARKRVKRRRGRSGRRTRRAVLRVKWRGRDRAGAPRLIPSGIRSYALYMRRGHRRYRRIRRATRRHSARLKLRRGVYRFYTRAIDRSRNREAKPRRADVRVVVR